MSAILPLPRRVDCSRVLIGTGREEHPPVTVQFCTAFVLKSSAISRRFRFQDAFTIPVIVCRITPEICLILSDEYTNPVKRRAMMEKRQRKVLGIEKAVQPPKLRGAPGADVTLVGWGSTDGVIREAIQILKDDGISANQLQVRWLVPLQGEAIVNKHRIVSDRSSRPLRTASKSAR
jgi:pyruvate/2-oxoacid:ferredoxin oxidoreductase alpha subunit